MNYNKGEDNYSMNKEGLRDFCIKHNLPFTVEFEEPWYPKPIKISSEDINNTERLIEIINQAIKDEIFYGKYEIQLQND